MPRAVLALCRSGLGCWKYDTTAMRVSAHLMRSSERARSVSMSRSDWSGDTLLDVAVEAMVSCGGHAGVGSDCVRARRAMERGQHKGSSGGNATWQ